MTGTLGDLADPPASLDLRPPLVTVIGEVVSLREQLRWFDVTPALEAAPARRPHSDARSPRILSGTHPRAESAHVGS